MPGVFLVTEGQAFQPVIDDIMQAENSSIEGEWENRVVYLQGYRMSWEVEGNMGGY